MSAKPGSWRGSFCRRARAQTGVRCFHRVGCEKSGTAGCPPNMESGAGFGRRQKFEQPLCRQPRLFRSAVGAFFAKRRAANPARPGRAHGAKHRKQIFLKPPLVAALSLRSVRRRLRSPFRRVPLPHLFFYNRCPRNRVHGAGAFAAAQGRRRVCVVFTVSAVRKAARQGVRRTWKAVRALGGGRSLSNPFAANRAFFGRRSGLSSPKGAPQTLRARGAPMAQSAASKFS